MIRILSRCLSVTLLSIPAIAACQTPQEQPETVIKTYSNLVVVDVVVTNGHQDPIHNLKASDFTVLEDGKPQPIKVFEEHVTAEAPAPVSAPKTEPGVFTNQLSVPTTGSLNILLLDMLNTPVNDQTFVREQVLKYLKQAPPGRRIAIFGLSQQLRLLQGFTTDPEVLRAALNQKKAGAKVSPLMSNPMNGDVPGRTDDVTNMIAGAADMTGSIYAVAILDRFMRDTAVSQGQLRITYTLDGLNQLARYLSQLPGRKNLIWFSASFPVSVLPDGRMSGLPPSARGNVKTSGANAGAMYADSRDPFRGAVGHEKEFRETVDLMARAQVAVYPVDARGIRSSTVGDASDSEPARRFAHEPGAYGDDQGEFHMATADEQSTMMQMAYATGGKAFASTNNLADTVGQAMAAGANYYTIAYSPTNQEWKGEYRKIQVKTAQDGLKSAYRRGYFADDPSSPVRQVETGPAQEPYNPMHAAMLWGAPEGTEILFEANVRPSSTGEEDSLAPGNQSTARAKGPYRRYTVSFATHPGDVTCQQAADGTHPCALEFETLVYDGEGKLINSQGSGIKANLPEKAYASVLRDGIHFKHEISVPVKGIYSLRIGVRDPNSGHVGTLALPVAEVNKLPPLTSADAAPGPPGAPR